MKPEVRKIVISVLCGLMIAYWARTLFGVARLASYQGAHWSLAIFSEGTEVPMIAVIVESLLLVGAALIPLVAAWTPQFGRKRWLLILWLPCIAYALFIGLNFFIHGTVTAPSAIKAVSRLLIWLTIAVLFLIDRQRRKAQSVRDEVVVPGR